MEIKLSSECLFTIRKIQNGTVGIPYDCAIEVGLASEVSIGNTECWIDGTEMEGFLSELKSLRATLNGKASLSSESPGEFLLELEAIDSLGHFLITIEIGRSKFIYSNQMWASVKNSFPLASAELETICHRLITYFEAELNA